MRGDVAPPQVGQLSWRPSATFSALGFLFGSPIIAAVILIEASGLGGPEVAAGARPRSARLRDRLARLDRHGIVDRPQHQPISRSARCSCPSFASPGPRRLRLDDHRSRRVVAVADVRDLPHRAREMRARRRAEAVPAAAARSGSLISGVGHRLRRGRPTRASSEVLFSGQDALGPLVSDPGAWSLSALALLVALQGARLRPLARGLSAAARSSPRCSSAPPRV